MRVLSCCCCCCKRLIIVPSVLGRSPRTRRYYILLHGDPVRLLSMFKGSIHPLNISSLHVHGVPSPELSCLHVHRGFSRYSVSFGKPFGHGPFSLPSSGDGPGRRSLFLFPPSSRASRLASLSCSRAQAALFGSRLVSRALASLLRASRHAGCLIRQPPRSSRVGFSLACFHTQAASLGSRLATRALAVPSLLLPVPTSERLAYGE